MVTCSREEPIAPKQTTSLDPSVYIVPTLITEPPSTKGVPIDTVSNMADFAFFCSYTNTSMWSASGSNTSKMYNRKMVRDAAAETATGNTLVLWKYADNPIVKWEANSAADHYSFFAYAPYETGIYDAAGNATGNGIVVTSAATTTGIPTLTYTVPSKVENQPDLMFAEPVYDLLPTGHPVRLPMRHALTAIGFRIAGSMSEKVTGLSVTGVYMSGNSKDDGSNIVWSLTGSKATTDYSASINFDSGQSYYTVTNTMTNPLKADGWLMMLPQVLDNDAKVRVSLSDGTYREVPLKMDNTGAWDWLAGKRIPYDIYVSPAGSTTVAPGNVVLPYPAQAPATQTLSVSCLKMDGTPDPTVPWTLTVPGSVTWLRLSTSSTGSPASSTASGTGSGTVYLVVDSNFGSSNPPRTVNLTLDGGTTIATTITQESYPGPNFSGWLYVKKDATGNGLNWNNALPTINDALSLAMLLRGKSYTVHGILVAGGPGRIYSEEINTGVSRVFGGWEGLAGTELPNNANAPYTSIFRDLLNYKVIIEQGVQVNSVYNSILVPASGVLDGFIIRNGVAPSLYCIYVLNGGVINAIEIINNNCFDILNVSDAGSIASNILLEGNTGTTFVGPGGKLINATVVNNTYVEFNNNAAIYNSIFWKNNSYSFNPSNTIQYCAFPTGMVPAGTGNIAIDPANNTAWYDLYATPGPHFNLVSDPARVPYMALNNRAPMLGNGNQTLFDSNTAFMPNGYKKDINGNPRHVLVTDMGCYEDQDLEGIKDFLELSSLSFWVSPSLGNNTRTFTVTSNGNWYIPTLPPNASVSPSSGGAGTTTVTITRSNTNFGLETFDIMTLLGSIVTVSVDNYYLEQDELIISNASVTDNVAEYVILVYGGSEKFTIISKSSWIKSATILPNGKLQLIADQSPDQEERTGFITLAHADDPAYQVQFDVVQTLNALEPFNFLVLKYTWIGNDVDIAVRFHGNSGPPAAPFDDYAVGWSVNNPPIYKGQTLLQWGGDATGGQGETVFLNAPLLDDDPNLPRYLTLQVFATWFNKTNAINNLVTLTMTTYLGGTMVQSGTNFNNNGGTLLYTEGFPCEVTTYQGVGTYGTGGYEHLCNIIYDQKKHSAKIVWFALASPSPSPSPAPPMGTQSAAPPISKEEMMKAAAEKEAHAAAVKAASAVPKL